MKRVKCGAFWIEAKLRYNTERHWFNWWATLYATEKTTTKCVTMLSRPYDSKWNAQRSLDKFIAQANSAGLPMLGIVK